MKYREMFKIDDNSVLQTLQLVLNLVQFPMSSEIYIRSKGLYLGPIQPPFFIHYLIKYRHIFLFIF